MKFSEKMKMFLINIMIYICKNLFFNELNKYFPSLIIDYSQKRFFLMR